MQLNKQKWVPHFLQMKLLVWKNKLTQKRKLRGRNQKILIFNMKLKNVQNGYKLTVLKR